MDNKPVYVTTNFTGRKFMCFGLSEDEKIVGNWAVGFTIGQIYYECRLDKDSENLLTEGDGLLLLMDDNKSIIYADANHFCEVEGMHKVINSMWIGLN